MRQPIDISPIQTQVCLPEADLQAFREVAKRSGRSVAELVREAVRRVWLPPLCDGPVALWDGKPGRTSSGHDTLYDEK